jgi:hypothetical protein
MDYQKAFSVLTVGYVSKQKSGLIFGSILFPSYCFKMDDFSTGVLFSTDEHDSKRPT